MKRYIVLLLITVLFFSEAEAKISKKIRNEKKNFKDAMIATFSAVELTELLSNNQYIPIKKNGEWGYADTNGNVIIEAKYREVRNFSEGLAVIKDFDENSQSFKYGVINTKGKVIIAAKYDNITDYKEGFAVLKSNTKYGYADKSGRVIVDTVFEEADNFSEKMAAVKLEGKYGYISENGKIKIKPKFDIGYRFSNGIARIKIENKYGYINMDGGFLKEPVYEEAMDFSEKMAVIKVNEKYGFIDTTGNLVYKPEYDFAFSFSEGMAVIKRGSKYGYINNNGNVTIEPQYDYANSFKEGAAVVELNKKSRYIKTNGENYFENEFSEGFSFSNGMAKVRNGNKYGFIDKSGNFVIEAKYDNAENFENGYTVVELERKKFIVNKNGNEIATQEYTMNELIKENIKDLSILQQDAFSYIDFTKAEESVIISQYSKILDNYFNEVYFSPWHKNKAEITIKDFKDILNIFNNNAGYGENKLPHEENWVKNLRELADEENYSGSLIKAITLKNVNMRLLPTNKPHYNDFNLPGEGYPFDNIQCCSVAVNTPIVVTHKSKDGAWYFVETAFAEGWLPADEVAFVDDEFVKKWESGKYISLINDDVILTDDNGIFRAKADIGTLFPFIAETDGKFSIYVAITDQNKKAILKKSKIEKEFAVIKPMEINQKNISMMINKMVKKPYGWGGLFDDRDCSSTLKDLFTPFGIWLPRNSAEQAKNGTFISLKNLKPEEREKMILDNGVPYLTLVWIKGHIMLYIGNVNNRGIVFHNIWGIKTKDEYGVEGRKIVGGGVITTLEPGKEIPEAYSSILNRIEGITLLVPSVKIQNIMTMTE